MPYPGRNNIYEAVIRRMVTQALEEQDREFAVSHGADSDEQLLAYLCHCSEALNHTPWPREIVGGCLIEQRFGSWGTALLKAKLPRPNTPDKMTCFARFQEETGRQKIVYRERKVARKRQTQQRIKAQKEKRSV